MASRKNLKTRWLEAFDETRNYRKRLESPNIPVNERIKCYSLHRDEVEALLRQHGEDIDGIRIYMGEKHFANNEFTIHLYVVPTKKERGSHGEIMYNDYNIPIRKDLEGGEKGGRKDQEGSEKGGAKLSHPILAPQAEAADEAERQQIPNLVELRPCPNECSEKNDLNS